MELEKQLLYLRIKLLQVGDKVIHINKHLVCIDIDYVKNPIIDIDDDSITVNTFIAKLVVMKKDLFLYKGDIAYNKYNYIISTTII